MEILRVIADNNSSANKRDKGKKLVELTQDFTVTDVETTGLDPRLDDIIELSAIKVHSGKTIDTYPPIIKNNTYIIDSCRVDL